MAVANKLLDTDSCAGSGEQNEFFVAFLHDLNPYVDELLQQPTFHRFLDLPAELRCHVYEQYFLDNKHSVACGSWPDLKLSNATRQASAKRQTVEAFLPKLCFTSKLLQDEATSCILESMRVELESMIHLFSLVLMTKNFKWIRIADRIRHVTILDMNLLRCLSVCSDEGADNYVEAAAKHNHRACTLLRQIPGLRQLNIVFHTPLLALPDVPNQPQLHLLQAQSIEKYLEGFDTQSVLGLLELQSLTIGGTSGSANSSSHSFFKNFPVKDDGKREHLQAISDLAQRMKDNFDDQGRKVVVTRRLLYGQEKEEVVLKS